MKPENLSIINQSFGIQAENFESKLLNFTKEEYLEYTLSAVQPEKEDCMLEVAAGTCVCGRSFAPHVKSLSRKEMLKLFEKYGIQIEKSETTELEQHLDRWVLTMGICRK